MPTYIVQMRLKTNKSDADAPAKFDARFNRKLDRKWQFMVATVGSRAALAARLNREIWIECKAHIDNDLSITSTGVKAFQSAWGHGAGGLHESGLVPVTATSGGGDKAWKYKYDSDSKEADMFATAHFTERTILT